MDVRFYPPPAQPAAAPDAPCLGPSPCLDPYYCNKVNALLLFPPCSGCSVPGGGRRRRRARWAAGRSVARGRSRARSAPARGCPACPRGVNIAEPLPGFARPRDGAESDTICSILSFLLFATKDPCLGLPGGGGALKKIRKERRNTLGVCLGSGDAGREWENSVYFLVSPSPSLPALPAAGACGTASPPGISCQGSRRESGCRDPGDAPAPRRAQRSATLLFSRTGPGAGLRAGVPPGRRGRGTAPARGCAQKQQVC